jgi:ATP-dependent Clp protease ATP-binding subunit ClpA
MVMTEPMIETVRTDFEPPVATVEQGLAPVLSVAEMGGSGLLGFTLMEAIQSPWEGLREGMQERIIDQQPAINAIIDALDASEARIIGDNRPKGVLAFLGPTGVGKSETGKSLAELLKGNFIKIDCSDYSHGHEVTKLTGAPPSYVGLNIKPILNKEDVEQPGTVVLLDEIEKGSPALFNLLLQILGDGELRLNDGTITSFKNTIVILTSNLGASEMAKKLSENPLGFTTASRTPELHELETVATQAFKGFFNPEFINRLDKMVAFQPLSQDGLAKILDRKIRAGNEYYEDRYGARLTLSDATKTHLVGVAAQDRHMGARPLVRAFEQNVQSTFGRYLGSGQIAEGTHVRVFHETELGASSQPGTFVFAAERDPDLRKKVSAELELVPPPQDEEAPSELEKTGDH